MRLISMLIMLIALAGTQALAGEKAIRIGVLGDQSGVLGSRRPRRGAGRPDGGGRLWREGARQADRDHLRRFAQQARRRCRHRGRWYDVEGVDAITDVPLTSVALAVQNISREKKKVLLITAAASADLTGKACSPYTVHWMDDTSALSVGTARAVVAAGGNKWFFLTPDYAFGAAMERAATAAITAAGGTVVGSAKFPLGTPDYSSFLLTANSSPANIFALSTVGGETVTAVKQAAEFGLTQNNRKMVVFLMFLQEVNAIGLKAAQGLYITDGFYWDENEQTRAWSRRFFARMNKMPSKSQANTYAAVTNYLKALDAAKSDDAATVMRQMKSTKADYFGKPVSIRQNGRVAYDLTVYEVKSPAESKYPWDYYKPVRKVSADEAFGPDNAGECTVK